MNIFFEKVEMWSNCILHILVMLNSVRKLSFAPTCNKRQSVRVVKELVLKANGLCPREFKSRLCRFCFLCKKTTSQRFELWRAEPNRFLIYLLNHSDKMSGTRILWWSDTVVRLKSSSVYPVMLMYHINLYTRSLV